MSLEEQNAQVFSSVQATVIVTTDPMIGEIAVETSLAGALRAALHRFEVGDVTVATQRLEDGDEGGPATWQANITVTLTHTVPATGSFRVVREELYFVIAPAVVNVLEGDLGNGAIYSVVVSDKPDVSIDDAQLVGA